MKKPSEVSFKGFLLDILENRSNVNRIDEPGTPQLNGKVERSHRTDRKEFYQLLEYTNDVDLNRKLKDWETFYNYHRPHGAHEGKTPYEKLKSSILND